MRIVKDGRFYGQSGRMRFGQPWVGAYLYAVESVRTPATILGWSAAKDETKVCLCLKTSCVYGADDMSVSLRYEDGPDNVFVVIRRQAPVPGGERRVRAPTEPTATPMRTCFAARDQPNMAERHSGAARPSIVRKRQNERPIHASLERSRGPARRHTYTDCT